MSSTERNKVKSFGDPSIDHEEMADRFLVVGALKAPPVSNRVNLPNGVYTSSRQNVWVDQGICTFIVRVRLVKFGNSEVE